MNDYEGLLKDVSLDSNEKSFQLLFESFYAPLCVFGKRFIDDLEVREDIVQGVFAMLWEHRKQLNIKVSVRNYLMTSVRNGCLNYLRQKNIVFDSDSLEQRGDYYSSEASDSLFTLTELENRLEEALQKLPEQYRKVYLLKRDEKLTNIEIARQMAISTKSVERYSERVNKHLKNELKDFLPLLVLFI